MGVGGQNGELEKEEVSCIADSWFEYCTRVCQPWGMRNSGPPD